MVRGGYHRVGSDWFASSKYLDIGNFPGLRDNLAYYVEGREGVVKALKLILNVNNPSCPELADGVFWQTCRSLLKKATGTRMDQLVDEAALNLMVSKIIDGKTVTFSREEWGTGRGYSRRLTIEVVM